MKREAIIAALRKDTQPWDIVIIGGGATGLGAALEAVTRGYRTLLLEQVDFAKSTSSKSTKLVHGGVRYLAQGDVSLVREASVERGLLAHNAPHLVRNLTFVIPTFSLWENLKYTIGLKMYDWLAGRLSLGKSVHISKAKTLERLSTLKQDGLAGGVLYHDGQFDDSRLAVNLAQTIADKGGTVLNYVRVTGLQKDGKGNISGITVKDTLDGGAEWSLPVKAVINATGVFADDVLEMDNPEAPKSIAASQGVHLVLDRDFLPGHDALMIPATSDGRVLFIVPWHNKVVVGTTDTPVKNISLEPHALEEEIQFILRTAQQYLAHAPQRSDVRSVWAGLRPLAAPKAEGHKTKEISRSHKIMVAASGLVTIIGGKWTTYRRMAEDVIHQLELALHWKQTSSVTHHMKVHGATDNVNWEDPWYFYGSDALHIHQMVATQPDLQEVLSEAYHIIKAQVVWAVREEMARNIEDFLARRTRLLFLDAREALRIAPAVAAIMAAELNKGEDWVNSQLSSFSAEAKGYLLS
ncbi:glycerol-3-phosphate dehydrogenase/oxidase [Chitinophaga nivalis]|uniref:Glycerol-3-phosphate dehydrogenase/oxidase n=1 Tax=Chitinophaga nivalis TaxID=2991709 RepID=A0ABT3IFC0_9BACT|nr:glycerol-3-phosphate dehydrogenase/oxidase [Chitinophaga nivalis]MCW3467808.1 glycerol-3-phosphate dehydrogenase/oxidase [Chitinophaga nivalis]MCW3482500.1 glycerol-3-phosphate dehydrogenase/oxidase [Chitinophaga nivalis]